MLSKARELYLQDVIIDGKRYDRYVNDFVNSHRYIDCDNAICKNCHEMNIHIVKGLLTDCANLVKPLFTAGSFPFEKCMDLKQTYDTSEPEPLPQADGECWYWTSTEVEGQQTAKAWLYSVGSGAMQETPKTQAHRVRPIITLNR